ncbi:hypothetical protein THAOC_14983 [Thalassiosira oceanica]|uniref:Uncharacterized protein n=1 Tax=Thalassiosira oceanica TaxID=159749 RepID=K0SDX9_THAOC|nr:hypothetical protein THAOC_14983 [Thalassiosira oceanica]|eukprot:EJK64298.1 hypothetical protein THAOC_14983 [Thalassiosira oceanica]
MNTPIQWTDAQERAGLPGLVRKAKLLLTRKNCQASAGLRPEGQAAASTDYPRFMSFGLLLSAADIVGDGTGLSDGHQELHSRAAEAGDHGLTISPLINNDHKGGAFPKMLQQFCRAIGVQCTAQAQTQPHALYQGHPSRGVEAAATCRANHNSTVTTDGTPTTNTDDQVFFHNTSPKDAACTNNSGMDTTSVHTLNGLPA